MLLSRVKQVGSSAVLKYLGEGSPGGAPVFTGFDAFLTSGEIV
jgi:hypothetical protein